MTLGHFFSPLEDKSPFNHLRKGVAPFKMDKTTDYKGDFTCPIPQALLKKGDSPYLLGHPIK
jgi:hypothetical protein